MSPPLLRTVDAAEALVRAPTPVDPAAEAAARRIADDVARRGEAAVLEHGARLGDLAPGETPYRDREALDQARRALPAENRALLERVAGRIARFAEAQRRALADVDVAIPGGRAGHTVAPVGAAGCYAPGGRYPLPSSVLMTAVAARAAGVREVWVASPRPTAVTLAAAAVAGADGLLAVGGAQGIAALAFGCGPVPACDVVVGPGSRFVTAAKLAVSGRVRIDMLAGPSELLVVADRTADPALVAADLLAQAEHDPLAVPMLVACGPGIAERVEDELARQLARLPTAATARAALGNGFAVAVDGLDAALALASRLAPEHLELAVADPGAAARRCGDCGGLFVGAMSAEVIGDYGAGPNHTLPTGGTARGRGGLSVLDFLKVRTWIEIAEPAAAAGLYADAERLAEIEGLAGHAEAARRRRGFSPIIE
jgi:phosphoribosyl-ATP pyrophosphohydrolase/phosphoribosyl-AMP cyclohydrolase/histidinol dehydrogenase